MLNKIKLTLRQGLTDAIKYSLFYEHSFSNQKLLHRLLSIFLYFATYLLPNLIRIIPRLLLDDESYKRIVRKIPFLGISLLPDGVLINYWVDYGVIYEMYHCRSYERFYEPEKGSIVCDIGAHCGTYCLKTARRVGDEGMVIAVEPYPLSYKLLKINLKLNKINNVITVRAALSSKDGVGKLYLSDSPATNSTIPRRSSKFITVPLIKFDSLIKRLDSENRIQRIDLVKIDAEGAELEILEGMNESLSFIKRIVVAAYHTPDEASKLEEYLKKRGYKIKLYTNPCGSFIYASRE